jgi:hypothetical protein
VIARLERADEAIAALRDSLRASDGRISGLDGEIIKVTAERDYAQELVAEAVTARKAAEQVVYDVREELVKLTADEQSAITERDMLSADIDTLQARITAQDQLLGAERDSHKAHRIVMIAALRGLMVDTVSRLLQREIDRARKAQSTPDKLRAWAGNFYGMHAETCRAALRPVVTAWAAAAEVDGHALLDRIVAQHVEQSQTAIRLVADVDDADDMAATLERTLTRWESERAETVADALVREVLQHG